MSWLLVWLMTQLISLAAILFLSTLGLILIEFLVYPLALGIGALLAGLTAVFAGNWLVKDGHQTPVNPVVGRCELVAVVLAFLLLVGLGGDLLRVRLIFVVLATAVVVAAAAVYFAWRFRGPAIADPGKRRRVVIWLVVAVAAVPLVIFIASLFGWAGA